MDNPYCCWVITNKFSLASYSCCCVKVLPCLQPLLLDKSSPLLATVLFLLVKKLFHACYSSCTAY